MTDIENAVARHYGGSDLLGRIFAGLESAGVDRAALRPEDLAPVDEFHVGGREATKYAVAKMPLTGDSHVLDIGSGIGGTARFISSEIGCRVTGIDLTPEYVSVATALADLTGLAEKVTYKVANALRMPFEDGSFDAAITIHVAMNIPDREGLYGETARVLRPGATFCIFDVMRKNDEDLAFPVPWADSGDTSHLTTPDEMLTLLGGAGFEVKEVEDRTEFALDFFKKRLAAAADGPPPLGIHLLMGPTAPVKLKNTLSNVECGRVAPVLMIATRV